MKLKDKLEKQKEMHIRRWFVVAKNLAQTRGQGWYITFEEFFDLWSEDDRWLDRGRGSKDLCLSRRDMTMDWYPQNVEIITRRKMLQRENKLRWDR
jgi:hypothetical protein